MDISIIMKYALFCILLIGMFMIGRFLAPTSTVPSDSSTTPPSDSSTAPPPSSNTSSNYLCTKEGECEPTTQTSGKYVSSELLFCQQRCEPHSDSI